MEIIFVERRLQPDIICHFILLFHHIHFQGVIITHTDRSDNAMFCQLIANRKCQKLLSPALNLTPSHRTPAER